MYIHRYCKKSSVILKIHVHAIAYIDHYSIHAALHFNVSHVHITMNITDG